MASAEGGDRSAADVLFATLYSELHRLASRQLACSSPELTLGTRLAASPTGRAILSAFQGLSLTYTSDGLRLDPLTTTQRRILNLLDTTVSWEEHHNQALANCGKRG